MAARIRDAVITGCGVVTPVGIGVDAMWSALVAGRSACRPIRRFPVEDLSPGVAAEVAGFEADTDRAGAFAVAAMEEALGAAGMRVGDVPAPRLGVAIGTTLGGMGIFERWEAAEALPEGPESIPYFAPSLRVARVLAAGGPVATPQLACASGTWAVAMAALWVRQGRADVVIAGGTDLLCRFVVAGFNALRATAVRAQPFDRDRRGLVLGEGAAVVVIESEESARARRRPILATIAGLGAAGDAVHMTAPDREGRGAARAIAQALGDAELRPAEVGFVSAHGTGTPYNDAMEAAAFARAFGASGPPINSIKGAIGHTLGAAGAIEVVAAIETLRRGVIPPTSGLDAIDPACAHLDVVVGQARQRTVDVAVSTSSGFGGTNAAVVLKRGS